MAQAASREHDVRQAAIDLLVATGQFDDVYHYSEPADRGRKAGDLRAAVVAPVSGAESLEWDDVTAGAPLCKMTFNVIVMARHDDPATRDGTADLLLSAVRNALNGQRLAGFTFDQDTIVKNHAWLPETPPERRIRCVVECVYEAPTWNDFNTSE